MRRSAGVSKRRSSTAWTTVPRVAAALGFSGSLSITRNRYSSGHRMKSAARDGDSDAGGGGAIGSVTAVSVSMVHDPTACHRQRAPGDLVTIDGRRHRTA
ncbi:exported protein of unknown function [Streptantibioticus cattleyicolor NRRL 8057 = DSM 46488]|nr:exported protein of unknown function [Streptantibioticus cattleyicolor NRRL 8057 = DSM 46488]